MKSGVPASVYVMDDPRSGLRKVGMSINPAERTRQLRLRPHHVRHASTPSLQALRIEQVAHRFLALMGKHVQDELFSATVEECIAAIERAERVVAGIEAPPPAKPKKVSISLAVDRKLIERVDAWRAQQDLPVTFTAVAEAALREFLNSRE